MYSQSYLQHQIGIDSVNCSSFGNTEHPSHKPVGDSDTVVVDIHCREATIEIATTKPELSLRDSTCMSMVWP